MIEEQASYRCVVYYSTLAICQLFDVRVHTHTHTTLMQWRRQLWGTGARAPLDFQV